MGSTSDNWATEPIAIIGLSCKFAGTASSPENLWKLLAEGRSAWSEIPASRFNTKGTHHPNHEKLSTTNAKGAHFIEEDVGLFDAAFFNLSAETAAAMDPQFRLQLESAYEALENAGLPLSAIAGSNTSVFAGVFSHDYHEGLVRDEDQLPRFLPIGTFSAMSSNRLSHFFDLCGASMTVDTGCSTTLVALHQAVKSLRSREADMSIVSGANLLLNPDMFKVFGSLGMLSPDGRSYAFDHRANGYGRGEGVATIVVKRLSDAQAAGDPIRAIIRETWLNQDGRTETITSPSQAAQEALMRECYRRAGLDPRDTQYFEAHGTGTPTGDPIEARAIAAVFGGSSRREDAPLRIGSLKTNIGHTEAASGLASLVKVILSLERGLIPPSINFEKPNPKLSLPEWRLQVASRLEDWPAAESISLPRRASVNNFGYGGSNAHVILEAAPPDLRTQSPAPYTNGTNGVNGNYGHDAVTADQAGEERTILVLSARDEQTCRRMVSDLKEYLEKHRNDANIINSRAAGLELMRNLSYTLGERRTRFPWIAANQVRFGAEEGQGFLEEAIGALGSPQFTPVRVPSRRTRIGMVFTGQGAQWYAMGRELIQAYPIFKSSLKEAERHLRDLGADWSLLEELQRDPKSTRVHATALSIPICVALQIALVQLLAAWGIEPAAVVSHSSGEIAAAYAAGALDLRQAMAAAYFRAALAADPALRSPGDGGGMVAVGLGADEAQVYLERVASSGGKATIACINSPQSVTIAGDVSAVQEIEDMCKQEGVFARRLKVETGYHSHHMLPIAGPYLDLLRKHLPDHGNSSSNDQSKVAFSSAVTGGRVTRLSDIAAPEHWVGSLVQPVRFVEAFTDMVLGGIDGDTPSSSLNSGANIDLVLEIGPHTALAAPIREILSLPDFDGLDLPYWGALVRNEHAVDSMRTMAVNLLREGVPVNLTQINLAHVQRHKLRVLTDLPSYPWNHNNRHWLESRFNRSICSRDQEPHDFLGSLVPGVNPDAMAWRNIVRVAESPWLRDHVVQGNIVYPGAGYVCLAIEALKQQRIKRAKGSKTNNASGPEGRYRLRDVDLLAALVIPDTADGIEIQTKLVPVSDRVIGARGWHHFEVSSVSSDNQWTLHAKGSITIEIESTKGGTSLLPPAANSKRPSLSGYTRRIDPDEMFAGLRARGIYHGPKFQNTLDIEQDGKEPRSISRVTVADTAVEGDLPRHHVLHPTTLDAFVLSCYCALPGAGVSADDAKLPRSIQELWVSSRITREAGHIFRCDASLSHSGAQSFQASVTVTDDSSTTAEPILEIRDLVCQSMGGGGTISSPDADGNDAASKKGKWENELCSRLEWAADLSLPQPQALAQIKKDLSRPEHDVDRALVMTLRRVCVHYCHDALRVLTAEDITRLEPHHVKFHRWMKDLIDLANSGRQGPGSDTWTADSPEDRQRYAAQAAEQSVEGEMVCRLGPLLVPMLLGERPPLEVMMEDRLLYRYYADATRMVPSLLQMAALLRRVVHKNPRARVLEIGAGTGGATRRLLAALGSPGEDGPLVESWHFTDISSGFFEAARSEFAAWLDILRFDRLDIEKDPASQGFELGTYDIVVACEVLHATKSMARTMAHVHSLMKPGGTLLLMETTQDPVDIGFTFGLLPGWWLSEEPERETTSSLSVPFWDQILRGAGFSGIDVEIRDCESDNLYSFSTLMSTAPLKPNQIPRLSSTEEVVLVVSRRALPRQTALDSLATRIQEATGTTPTVVTIEDASAADGSLYSGKICVFLGEVEQPILHNLDSGSFEVIKTLSSSCKGLLWVTVGGAVECRDPNLSLSHGFLRALRNEYLGRSYVYLDLDPEVNDRWSPEHISTIWRVLELGFGLQETEAKTSAAPASSPQGEFEYAERGGVLLIPRFYKDVDRNKMVAEPPTQDWRDPENLLLTEPLFQEDRPLRLDVGIPGLLDTLAFNDDKSMSRSDVQKTNSPLPPDIVEIEPRAYGLNFRDVMVAMGQLRERVMGLECSGIITRAGAEAEAQGYRVGDRVMALLLGPFASRVRISWHGVVHMPRGLSFEEAASLPMIFGTAFFSLVEIARLRPGQSVLIHAAAGGVGQAAIMLAKRHLHAGAVYATVSSPEKRELLVREYGIPNEHIFSSRDASFAPAVLAATGGQGVDVVLNSLAGPLLQASFNVLAPFGHLVEIGKKDLEGNSLLEMGTFSRVASYTSVDMMTLLRRRGPDAHRVLGEIAHLVEEGVLKPIHPVTTYSMGEVSRAYRLLQTGKHTGKIVLRTSPDEQVKVLPRIASSQTAQLRPDASYLLAGGAGGLGRSIAHWLVDQGARNLILLSRSAGNPEKTGSFVSGLREARCRVMAISCDISVPGELAKALRACEDEGLPPVRGVIQGAMVLQDSIIEQMTLDDWRTCIRPKVDGTWNLHVEFSKPGSLDFFIMLSSLSGILGNVSQANYAAGSAYQDAMARWRTGRGLPSVSLDLGAVKGVGYVAETAGVTDRMKKSGQTIMLPENAVLAAIQAAIVNPPRDQPQILLGLNSGPGPQWDPEGKSQMSRDARYLPLTHRESHGQNLPSQESSGAGPGQTLAARLAQAESRDAAAELVGEAIADKLAVIFTIPTDEIDLRQPPAVYGIDSLVAVELRNMLVSRAAAEVSIFTIMQSASLAALALDVVAKSRFVGLTA